MSDDQVRTVAITRLRIGSRHTSLKPEGHADASAAVRLDIGFESTAKEFLKHSPPTPGELELAIYAIEDELATARKKIPTESILVTSDRPILGLLEIAGVDAADEQIFHLELFEQMYQSLVAVSQGAMPPRIEAELSPEYAATVLIIRELMHHLSFPAITMTTAGPHTAGGNRHTN
ncbi:MAG: hypothetical protein WBM80_08710 [Woeseiaceae bacterium]